MNAVLLVITLVSFTIAVVASFVALRVMREERRRAQASINALSHAIYGDSGSEPRMLEPREDRSRVRYQVAAIAATCLVVLLVGGVFVAVRQAGRSAPDVSASKTIAPAMAVPLELTALENERDGDRLIVRGLVRNPAKGRELDGVAAVVLVFGRDGTLIATGRAALPSSRLAPGATAPFVVSVPGAAGVEKFRLSFRTDAHIEPHVDRRTS